MTNQQTPLEQAVQDVVDPGLFYSLGELGILRSVVSGESATKVVIAEPETGHPAPREVTAEVAKAVAAVGGAPAEVSFVKLNEAQEVELGARLHALGHPSSNQGAQEPSHSHGGAGPETRDNPFADKSSRTRVIAVSSGKGGVGKSTVTVNLAVALARLGHSVGILDADVYGFSVPSMLGIERPPSLIGDLLIPPVAHAVRCISMGFFVEEDQAVMWRGPMLHKALEQFLVDVNWGSLDFLVLDLPPGTGDVAMSIAQFVPRAEVLVVTTPSLRLSASLSGRPSWLASCAFPCGELWRTSRGLPAMTASATSFSVAEEERSWPSPSACRCWRRSRCLPCCAGRAISECPSPRSSRREKLGSLLLA